MQISELVMSTPMPFLRYCFNDVTAVRKLTSQAANWLPEFVHNAIEHAMTTLPARRFSELLNLYSKKFSFDY